MAKYKGIEFAKGYNRSFADFKNEFGSTHVFKRLTPKEKEKELKEAYKIATSDNVSKPKKEEVVKEAIEFENDEIKKIESLQEDGNIDTTEAKNTTTKRKRSKRADI